MAGGSSINYMLNDYFAPFAAIILNGYTKKQFPIGGTVHTGNEEIIIKPTRKKP